LKFNDYFAAIPNAIGMKSRSISSQKLVAGAGIVFTEDKLAEYC